jgi:small subunit ribosomal protein S16
MAVKLRLKRMGAKQAPVYRIVAADSRSPRDGRFIEIVGFYNPTTQPAELKVDEALALKWLSQGALPTDTVRNLFSTAGVMKKWHEAKKQK